MKFFFHIYQNPRSLTHCFAYAQNVQDSFEPSNRLFPFYLTHHNPDPISDDHSNSSHMHETAFNPIAMNVNALLTPSHGNSYSKIYTIQHDINNLFYMQKPSMLEHFQNSNLNHGCQQLNRVSPFNSRF